MALELEGHTVVWREVCKKEVGAAEHTHSLEEGKEQLLGEGVEAYKSSLEESKRELWAVGAQVDWPKLKM